MTSLQNLWIRSALPAGQQAPIACTVSGVQPVLAAQVGTCDAAPAVRAEDTGFGRPAKSVEAGGGGIPTPDRSCTDGDSSGRRAAHYQAGSPQAEARMQVSSLLAQACGSIRELRRLLRCKAALSKFVLFDMWLCQDRRACLCVPLHKVVCTVV